MAHTVLGIGTSHGPLLNTPPDRWGGRATFDRQHRSLAFRGAQYPYRDLLAVREAGFAEQCRPQVWQRRHQACRAGLAELGALVAAADVDVLVIVSSDHKEVYGDELLPAFAVYWGDSVDHVPFTADQLGAMPPGLAVAALGDVPASPRQRPCDAELALHLIQSTSAAGFDPAASRQLPAGKYGNHGIPHGWGFVYQQVVGEDCPTPMVPVLVNTFWQPNPPSADRCYEFGRALGSALAGYPKDLRIGLVASGGLTHFVIDEELDRRFLDALVDGDTDYLRAMDADLLVSGTSELRNWIVVAGALEGSGLRARVVDYQPCYRTEAGTGCAMGFVAWQQAGPVGATSTAWSESKE